MRKFRSYQYQNSKYITLPYKGYDHKYETETGPLKRGEIGPFLGCFYPFLTLFMHNNLLIQVVKVVCLYKKWVIKNKWSKKGQKTRFGEFDPFLDVPGKHQTYLLYEMDKKGVKKGVFEGQTMPPQRENGSKKGFLTPFLSPGFIYFLSVFLT